MYRFLISIDVCLIFISGSNSSFCIVLCLSWSFYTILSFYILYHSFILYHSTVYIYINQFCIILYHAINFCHVSNHIRFLSIDVYVWFIRRIWHREGDSGIANKAAYKLASHNMTLHSLHYSHYTTLHYIHYLLHCIALHHATFPKITLHVHCTQSVLIDFGQHLAWSYL